MAAPGAEDSSWSADLTLVYVDNPAADDKPAGDDFPGTEEDTNAVVSPSHVGFLLTRVGATLVALPPALPYVVLTQLGLIVTLNTYQKGEVSALSRTFDICVPAGAFLVADVSWELVLMISLSCQSSKFINSNFSYAARSS